MIILCLSFAIHFFCFSIWFFLFFLFCFFFFFCLFFFFFFFFFSSRRRHTRYWRDWSSDVCSSDLARPRGADGLHGFVDRRGPSRRQQPCGGRTRAARITERTANQHRAIGPQPLDCGGGCDQRFPRRRRQVQHRQHHELAIAYCDGQLGGQIDDRAEGQCDELAFRGRAPDPDAVGDV